MGNRYPGDLIKRTHDALTALLLQIGHDIDASWRHVPANELTACEDAAAALDDLVGDFVATVSRINERMGRAA